MKRNCKIEKVKRGWKARIKEEVRSRQPRYLNEREKKRNNWWIMGPTKSMKTYEID